MTKQRASQPTQPTPGSSRRRRSYTEDKKWKAISLPGNVVKTQTYYALLQSTTEKDYPFVYTMKLNTVSYGTSRTTITLDSTVTFNNTRLTDVQAAWRYFEVDTSSVPAPKVITVHLKANHWGSSSLHEETNYRYVSGPTIFMSSQHSAMLEADQMVTDVQLGRYPYPSRLFGNTMTSLKPAFSWHQPRGEKWNKMYVTLAMTSFDPFRRRKLLGGDNNPIQGSYRDTTYQMKVTAQTITSCTKPTGLSATVKAKDFSFTVDYEVNSALTADNNALLYSSLHANNLEMPDIVFTLAAGCSRNRDKTSYQRINIPKCSTKDFYAIPQCKDDCDAMRKCINFKVLPCDEKPSINCENLTGSTSSSSECGGGCVAVIIIILLLCIGGIVGGIIGCYCCCCKQETQTGMQPAAAATAPVMGAPYAGAPIAQPVTGMPTSAASTPVVWTQYQDPASGRPYWSNGTETTWDDPNGTGKH